MSESRWPMSAENIKKGYQFEEKVKERLNQCGFQAWRTNCKNKADRKGYRAGFDGGVDVIAEFEMKEPVAIRMRFFIQCKCWKNNVSLPAVREPYCGRDARKEVRKGDIPVLIATLDASKATRRYAKDLGVEMILAEEIEILKEAEAGKPVPYKNYGKLMQLILYFYTKDTKWLESLSELQEESDVQYANLLREIDALTDEEKRILHKRLESDPAITGDPQMHVSSKKILSSDVVDNDRTDEEKTENIRKCCPYCDATDIKKHGRTKNKLQRYYCKNCRKSFTENRGTNAYYSHLKEWQWLEAKRGLADRISFRELAENMKVSVKTALLCRNKMIAYGGQY